MGRVSPAATFGLGDASSDPVRLRSVEDDELIARAEQALTEIKVNHGLSEEHEAVLAALRIRLKGVASGSLEEMLAAADDPGEKTSLDDLLGQEPEKPEWPS